MSSDLTSLRANSHGAVAAYAQSYRHLLENFPTAAMRRWCVVHPTQLAFPWIYCGHIFSSATYFSIRRHVLAPAISGPDGRPLTRYVLVLCRHATCCVLQTRPSLLEGLTALPLFLRMQCATWQALCSRYRAFVYWSAFVELCILI